MRHGRTAFFFLIAAAALIGCGGGGGGDEDPVGGGGTTVAADFIADQPSPPRARSVPPGNLGASSST